MLSIGKIFSLIKLRNKIESKINYFDLLPPETIEFIFKKLNLEDLINLRIVNKRFKEICDQIKIKQLIVSDELDHNYYYPSFWFYKNNPIYFNKENLTEFYKFPNYSTIFQLDKRLKRLALNINNFNFSILNEFKLLEQLRVETNELIDNYKLSLDHLKIADFEIKIHDNSDFKLTLDTIKLFAFRFSEYLNINVIFNYADKILFLEIDYTDPDWSLYNDYLKNFNNLQYFKIISPYTRLIDRNILSQFKNLKILDLFILIFVGISIYYYSYDNSIEDIKFIINEKEKSRSKLEIYLNGVKLVNKNKINQLKLSSYLDEFDHNLLEFQIKNYDLLKDNCGRGYINYCDLIKLIKIVPSSFTNKFPFIYDVKANDHIDNEDQFIKFLNNLQYLSKLILTNCELTKSFYDQLINLVYLNNLVYFMIEEKNDLEMNFDFILNLKRLKLFSTNQNIINHIDLINKLFKENDLMILLAFKFDLKNFIHTFKRSDNRFEIRSYYLDNNNLQMVHNFTIDYLKDLDNVISKLKELKF